MIVNSAGVELYVAEHGAGDPVLLLHGWPDSSALWRDQVLALTAARLRVITPDMRGFSASSRPQEVASYKLSASVADVAAVLDALGVETAHLVGHDWGAGVAWLTAMFLPDRVRTLTVLSVPHPRAEMTPRQREMAWYQLFFQFEGIAEASLMDQDWALLREWAAGYTDIDQAIELLSRPGALTASLNWYRANLAPRMPSPPRELPPVTAPTLAIWSDGDRYLDGARVRASGDLVAGPWRYEEIAGASHWIPLDAPERLTELLLGWFETVS